MLTLHFNYVIGEWKVKSMGIQASCTFDEKTLTALNRCMLTARTDPKKRLWTIAITYAMIAILVLIDLWWFGPNSMQSFMLTVMAILFLFILYRYFFTGKIRYRRLGSMQGIVNSYVFHQDAMEVTSNGTGYNADGEIQYCLIKKVKETSAYFFIFMNNNQAFIVDKSTITGGTADQIREYLATWVDEKKYIVCKY